MYLLRLVFCLGKMFLVKRNVLNQEIPQNKFEYAMSLGYMKNMPHL